MIPAEAVEAAAKQMAVNDGDLIGWALYQADAQRVLEAAAPYIRAQALEDAAAEIASDKDPGDIHIIAWLHMRAAAERGGE